MKIIYPVLFLAFLLMVAVLDRKFLHLHQLNKYSGGRRVRLGTLLFIRAIALALFLAAFLASIVFSIEYPIILRISHEVAFGEIYAISFFCFNLGYIFVSILNNGLDGYDQIFYFWAKVFERLWLVGMKKDSREQYNRHGAWRWSVLARRFRIWLSIRKPPSVHFTRVIALCFAGGAAIFSLFF